MRYLGPLQRVLPDCSFKVLEESDRGFWKYSAPSMCIGYQINVSALQMARAYLTLLSGAKRQLRLVKEVEANGQSCKEQRTHVIHRRRPAW